MKPNMKEAVILIPEIDSKQNIEIDVRINGKQKSLTYRIEIVSWEGSEPTADEQFNTIKKRVDNCPEDWELVHIGNPENNKVPVMFRKNHEEAC